MGDHHAAMDEESMKEIGLLDSEISSVGYQEQDQDSI